MTKRTEFKRILEAHGIEPESELLDELEAVGKRERTQANAEHATLVALFCQVTGLAAPEPVSSKERRATAEMWWQPLRRIQAAANGESEWCLREAVSRMRAQSLTIYSPKSVEKTAVAIFAERGMATREREHVPADPFGPLAEYMARTASRLPEVSPFVHSVLRVRLKNVT